MSNYDWSKFSLKINIQAPASAIYLSWTVPELLEKWFLRKAIFRYDEDLVRGFTEPIQTDDAYEWYWHGYDDATVEKGKVMLANGVDQLQFSFTGGALVTVDIGEVAGENIVMLTQENIPTNDHGKIHYHMGCQTGWTFYLTNLKSYLEGGLDLRNKNNVLTSMVNS